MQITARRFDTAEPVTVSISDGHVTDVTPAEPSESLPWIAPGLVDLQVNGYRGQEFNDFELTPDKVREVSVAMDADGVTSYCPTMTTHSFEMLSHALRILNEARESFPEVAARVPGFHLEGPYLSAADGPRGAHPREHCRPPDWDEFQRLQEAAGGHIRILTMSPEYGGIKDSGAENSDTDEFIRKVVASGVLVAIGHTAADSDQIRRAVDAGARLSTHLGNGAHGQIRRHPNYIWDQLADDRLTASLIADGHHLPASVVKSFVRGKTPDRCILVSDITGMGGMPPGRYESSSIGAVEVLEDGRLVVAGQRQYLAGAALPLTCGIPNVMQYAGVDLRTAIEMCTTRPASLIQHECGGIATGSLADLILFELPASGPVRILMTINHGEQVHAART